MVRNWKFLTFIVGAAFAMIVSSGTAFARVHASAPTFCITLQHYSKTLSENDPGFTPAETFAKSQAFCDKYTSAAYTRYMHDNVVHTDAYKAEHAAAVAELVAIEPKLGDASLNVSFMLVNDDADHEWMPGLLYAATALDHVLDDAAKADPMIAGLLANINTHLAAIGRWNPDLFEKDHSNHYAHVHPIGEAMISLTRRMNMLADNNADIKVQIAVINSWRKVGDQLGAAGVCQPS